MTAAKKSRAAVPKRDRRQRTRQPPAPQLRNLTPTIGKNIDSIQKEGLDIEDILRGPMVVEGKSK